MSEKSIIMLGMFIGSSIGGYLPSLFGASLFSLWSVFSTAIGGIIGIYLAYKWLNG